jgi:hypothetical protein
MICGSEAHSETQTGLRPLIPTVAVYKNPTEHKIRFHQVHKWAAITTKDGLAGIVKRQKMRTLLGAKNGEA